MIEIDRIASLGYSRQRVSLVNAHNRQLRTVKRPIYALAYQQRKTTEPVVAHRNYLVLFFFFLAAARAAVATVAAFSALLAKGQLAMHKEVTNDCKDLLVFLLEFLRLRFSRMTSFASNKAFFAVASA